MLESDLSKLLKEFTEGYHLLDRHKIDNFLLQYIMQFCSNIFMLEQNYEDFRIENLKLKFKHGLIKIK
jgi:hypothetical protein